VLGVVICWSISIGVLAWRSPILLGLICAPLLSRLLSQTRRTRRSFASGHTRRTRSRTDGFGRAELRQRRQPAPQPTINCSTPGSPHSHQIHCDGLSNRLIGRNPGLSKNIVMDTVKRGQPKCARRGCRDPALVSRTPPASLAKTTPGASDPPGIAARPFDSVITSAPAFARATRPAG
jgi:hypothetical protein